MTPAWLHWPQTQALVAAFAAHTNALRFVGGAVRDALLGREVTDVDAATTLRPAASMALLEKAGIRVIPTGLAHGTVTAVIGGKSFEITTLRRDVATFGRRARVAFTDDWQADASRRDFTLNAMYLSPEGELFDYFNGAEDAKNGVIRFIGNAEKRIGEDYLRILRFFRFYAYYGKGDADRDALAACRAQASFISTLSGERVQHELCKLLQAPLPSPTLRLMHAYHLLSHILGFAIASDAIFERFDAIGTLCHLAIPYPVRLSGFVLKALIPEENAFTKLTGRLRLSNHIERGMHIQLQACHVIHPKLSPAEQKKLIRTLGNDDFRMALVLAWAAGSEPVISDHPYNAMLALASQWRAPKFPVSGDDLIALGVRPGKAMGELLDTLEERWEKGDYRLTREELLSRI